MWSPLSIMQWTVVRLDQSYPLAHAVGFAIDCYLAPPPLLSCSTPWLRVVAQVILRFLLLTAGKITSRNLSRPGALGPELLPQIELYGIRSATIFSGRVKESRLWVLLWMLIWREVFLFWTLWRFRLPLCFISWRKPYRLECILGNFRISIF